MKWKKSMVVVSDASAQIYDRVSKLTKDNLDQVNKKYDENSWHFGKFGG